MDLHPAPDEAQDAAEAHGAHAGGASFHRAACAASSAGIHIQAVLSVASKPADLDESVASDRQVLEAEKMQEVLAAREIPSFQPGDVVEVKLVSDPLSYSARLH